MTREIVLGRIHAALQGAAAHPDETSEVSQASAYQRASELSCAEVRQLFDRRLEEYGARVFHCGEHELAEKIAAVLLQGNRRTIAIPAGTAAQWLDSGIEWMVDEGLSFAQLDAVDGVLTAATAAVAESGSIVLQHGPSEGRRALTLLPDYHLCILFDHQIVATLPECFDRLRATAARPTTFISGPSATADIEMTRIKGVHGPRSLDVVVVSSLRNAPAEVQ